MFYPVNAKDEKDKEESSHYIYVCKKNPGWVETYKKNFESEITKLILHEKRQAAYRDDEDEDENDMSAYRVTQDLQKAKIKAESKRSNSITKS